MEGGGKKVETPERLLFHQNVKFQPPKVFWFWL